MKRKPIARTPKAQAVSTARDRARRPAKRGKFTQGSLTLGGLVILALIHRYHAAIDPEMSAEEMMLIAGCLGTVLQGAVQFVTQHFIDRQLKGAIHDYNE